MGFARKETIMAKKTPAKTAAKKKTTGKASVKTPASKKKTAGKKQRAADDIADLLRHELAEFVDELRRQAVDRADLSPVEAAELVAEFLADEAQDAALVVEIEQDAQDERDAQTPD
jgi:hypothetical protein